VDATTTFGLIFVGLIALAAVGGVLLRGNYEKVLRSLAQPFGFAYERLGAPVGVGHAVRGYLDGRPFELLVVPEGHYRARMLSERWTIHLAGTLPPGFAAGRNGWGRRPSAGLMQVPIGDAAFDRAVFVEGRAPQEVHWVLGAEPRRAAIRDLAAMDAIIYENKVMLHKSGFDTKLAKLQARLQRLRAIAQTIDPVGPVAAPPPAR
jgi:hypothetical protein